MPAKWMDAWFMICRAGASIIIVLRLSAFFLWWFLVKRFYLCDRRVNNKFFLSEFLDFFCVAARTTGDTGEGMGEY